MSRLGLDVDSRSRWAEKRKASRTSYKTDAWIRPNGGFALRPCKILNVSSLGVLIAVDDVESVSDTFRLLNARNASTGRRARVKWRRGKQIGAEFF